MREPTCSWSRRRSSVSAAQQRGGARAQRARRRAGAARGVRELAARAAPSSRRTPCWSPRAVRSRACSARLVAALSPRPVIVTGLPGISIPATTQALVFRAQCDLFVLHSTREVREFADSARRARTGAAIRARRGCRSPTARLRPTCRGRAGPTWCSPAQAIVPRERAERLRVARLLVAAAEADPAGGSS